MKQSPLLSILAVLISLATLTAQGGDWKSAGAPELPYNPKYKYVYSCELELQETGLQEGRGLVSVGITRFELTNGKHHLTNLDHMAWRHEVRDYRDLSEKTVDEPLPFSLAGHRVYLNWEHSERGDRLNVNVWLERSVGEFHATFENEGNFAREQRQWSMSLRTGLARKDGAKHANLSGRLTCEKIK